MTLQGALVLARAVHFAACAVLWGGGGLLWLLRDADGVARAGRTIVRVAAAVAAVSGVAWLAATLVIITADPGSLVDLDAWSALWSSSFGPPWAIRLALSAVGLGLALFGRSLAWFSLCGAALAIDQAWLGHAATGTGTNGALMLAGDALHVTAAYAWTGALPILGLLVWRQPRSPAAAKALTLFSTIGIFTVATILASGVVNAAFRFDTPAQVLATPYGRILAIKVALFGAMLGLAWRNRTLAASDRRERPSGVLLLGVLVETGLGMLVLAIAALLGTTAPPL